MSQHPKAQAKPKRTPRAVAVPKSASASTPEPSTQKGSTPVLPQVALPLVSASNLATLHVASSAAVEPLPTIFFPTLLPSLLEESSPELCWEWRLGAARVAARLTQFGWNASAYAAGSVVGHWRADSLDELRTTVLQSALPLAFFDPLRTPWVLAYDVAGF